MGASKALETRRVSDTTFAKVNVAVESETKNERSVCFRMARSIAGNLRTRKRKTGCTSVGLTERMSVASYMGPVTLVRMTAVRATSSVSIPDKGSGTCSILDVRVTKSSSSFTSTSARGTVGGGERA